MKITRSLLSSLSNGGSFPKGIDYFEEKRVSNLVVTNDTATATVYGSYPYSVRLRQKGKSLDYYCSCPVGQEGNFCKHCVAVGLATIADEVKFKNLAKVQPSVTAQEIKAHLMGLEKVELVEMLIAQAETDRKLMQSLMLRTSQVLSRDINLAYYHKEIDSAFETGGYIDYYETHSYCNNIQDTIELIKKLAEGGYYKEIIELSEYALNKLKNVYEIVDDSNGYLGDILNELQEIHLEACKKAPPDPIELATKLFNWELKSEWGEFSQAVKTYAEVLGKEGIAEYRRLAEAKWKKVPIKTTKNGSDRWDNYAITEIMESLTELDGDYEALIEIKKRDLSSQFRYFDIAEIYRKEKHYDLALEWALKGLKAFPDEIDHQLHEFLISEYSRRKDFNEVVKIIWKFFCYQASLERYIQLKAVADKLQEWNAWREKALNFIYNQLDKSKKPLRHGYYFDYSGSVLVEIYIWESDLTTALREARIYGCYDEIWLKLAKSLIKSQPDDAVKIYLSQVEKQIAHTKNYAYEEAIKLLGNVADIYKTEEVRITFAQYLAELRIKYKPKRNFIALLDKFEKKLKKS